jgi:hypothetical protein
MEEAYNLKEELTPHGLKLQDEIFIKCGIL